jgi:hypothetical protein
VKRFECKEMIIASLSEAQKMAQCGLPEIPLILQQAIAILGS